MTTEDLSLIPLFSKVNYQGTTVVLLKKKSDAGILFDSGTGWVSFYIPASDFDLVEEFQPPVITTPPTSLADIPVYAPVTAGGESGILIEKNEVTNPYTNEKYYAGLVWFGTSESALWYDGDQIAYSGTPGGNGNQAGTSDIGKLALYAGGAYLAYKLIAEG